ncbi:TetR/AcrR family transcriptional regulator [Lachnospira multipara]|uniref:DNA-binding transcriptional regulator, AcrR family n=1 Tax=Lachnospira multipara TaxID=28051 RepID=A0A1H5WJQ7_9FIRM|nr:TetR/AcrR family transcriptional regulator [Lachnospira multipara]SEF99595.1 DNA-binding transcriptional regulator, AcrR family [Lachnospira multipara]
MGKLENNKINKQRSLLNSAFELFTTKGVSKTSIAEISSKAGMAKGTFYLYFKDKFDIRNRLISHESSLLFSSAVAALDKELEKRSLNFTEKIIFLIDNIINALDSNQTLLNFISKNLSWGIFKEALTTNVADNDINFLDVYHQMINDDEVNLREPEIMLFLIVELISSTCYSAILYKEPADIETAKPFIYATVRNIIKEHTILE